MKRYWFAAHTGCRYAHDLPPVHVYPVHDACKVCRHPREGDSVPEGGGPIVTISLTRSFRALAESDPMEESAAFESLQMIIADGGV